MSKRLQVLINDSEYREIQRLARSRRVSIAQWVRSALHLARSQETSGDPSRKLEAVRAAARHSYPVADIGQILSEIEHGYLDSREES